MDQINECEETTEFIYNYLYIDKLMYDLPDNSTSNILQLCDVCCHNVNVFDNCSLCNRKMVDCWLKITGDFYFCQFCIS